VEHMYMHVIETCKIELVAAIRTEEGTTKPGQSWTHFLTQPQERHK